ncbi:hypothetical protein V6N11_013845 [Hibiscus sabdariffa]|uniref:CCHC-type domain-containing protein n=1 Tax=Hibiscus sabdariffa TaxID=183260 RepID=A0ABR2NAA0_9ROSI
MPEMTASKGRGKGGVHGKGRGRCKGQSGQRQQYRNSIQCYNCGKYGHIQANCWYKDEKMNFAEEDENEEEETFDPRFRFNSFKITLDAYNEAENLLSHDITTRPPLLVLEALLLFGKDNIEWTATQIQSHSKTGNPMSSLHRNNLYYHRNSNTIRFRQHSPH